MDGDVSLEDLGVLCSESRDILDDLNESVGSRATVEVCWDPFVALVVYEGTLLSAYSEERLQCLLA